MRNVLMLLAAMLGGCATQPPANPADAQSKLSGATIAYSLPITEASVSQELMITGCAEGKAKVQSTINVAVAAVQGPEQYVLSGKDWSSWTKSRDVTITLHDNGAIKTLNATSSDRTFAVVTNIIKGLTAFQGIGSPNDSGLSCQPATQGALKTVAYLESQVKTLRDSLATMSDANQIAATIKTIDALAAQAATLKTSKLLTISLPAKAINLDGQAGRLVWANSQLSDWLIKKNTDEATDETNGVGAALTLGYCLQRSDAGPIPCDRNKLKGLAPQAELSPATAPAASAPCKDDVGCKRTLVLRPPVAGVATFVAVGQGYGTKTGQALKVIKLPIAQWGQYTYVSLDVGLAQSRTVGLSLDEYGRATSLTWKSDARAESITGGAVGVLEATSAYRKVVDGEALAERNAYITDLESRQKYNKIRLCEEIIKSGGFKCPES